MSAIIRIEPVEKSISMTWLIGIRCNYDCMYCPTTSHDAVSKHPNLERLQTVWRNFYEKTKNQNLPYKLSFSGGEVTANKSFLPLIRWLKENYNVEYINVTSNGSASANYYLKLAEMVESISFSVHSEHINEQKFFGKAEKIDRVMIRPEKSFHVNIMDEFWNKDRIAMYQKWLDDRNISNSVNQIDYTQQTRTFPIMQGDLNLVT